MKLGEKTTIEKIEVDEVFTQVFKWRDRQQIEVEILVKLPGNTGARYLACDSHDSEGAVEDILKGYPQTKLYKLSEADQKLWKEE
ncbi:hypothetical protein LCGC14_1450990 [marine sediment metagenome]|uniref:Uncharacterized protein n=1 Tax=marine sediment metagenome TaxID=412755 RepID=A0A0F9JIM0_9ZZZZ